MNTDPSFSNPTAPAQPGQVPASPMQPPGYLPDDFWEQAPRGSPFLKFALITLTTLIVLAILAFVGLRVFQVRQHHLAEGYLFQGLGQLLYFHVQESFFGGAVAGTFYPAGAACAFGLGADTSHHVSGEVTDTALTLKDDEGDASGSAVAVTFRRDGPAMVLTSADGTSFGSPRPPLGMTFEPSTDAAYAQAQGRFCPSLPGF